MDDAPDDRPLGVWIGSDIELPPDEDLVMRLVFEALALPIDEPLPRPTPEEMAELIAEDIRRKTPEELSAALVSWAVWYSDDHPEDTWKPSSSSSEE